LNQAHGLHFRRNASTPLPTAQGITTSYVAMNRNKRSMEVDTKSEAGKQIVYDLVKVSDVVVNNFRAGVMDHPVLGKLTVVGCPVHLSDAPVTVRRTPPLLGEHTEEILLEFGLTADDGKGEKAF